MDKPGILIAADLTPAETSHFEPATVLGICTAAGGPTSHTAILARELDIPAVVGLGNGVLALRDGQQIILDGESGKVFVDPESKAKRELVTLTRKGLEVVKALVATHAEGP